MSSPAIPKMTNSHHGNSDKLVVRRAEALGTGFPTSAGSSSGGEVVSKVLGGF